MNCCSDSLEGRDVDASALLDFRQLRVAARPLLGDAKPLNPSLLCRLVLVQDIEVAVAETVCIPELGIRNFLILRADILELGVQDRGQLGLD